MLSTIQTSERLITVLIDIFWSDIRNQEVLDETFKIIQLNPAVAFPHSLQRYFDLIKEYQMTKKKNSPFYIIEPYGESLEKLSPAYFAEQRAFFYQEQ